MTTPFQQAAQAAAREATQALVGAHFLDERESIAAIILKHFAPLEAQLTAANNRAFELSQGLQAHEATGAALAKLLGQAEQERDKALKIANGCNNEQCGVCVKCAESERDEARREVEQLRLTGYNVPALILSQQANKELSADNQRLREALKTTAVKCFNIGCLHGHEDTVEARFIPIMPQDISTYNEDIVSEMLSDGSLPEAKEALSTPPPSAVQDLELQARNVK